MVSVRSSARQKSILGASNAMIRSLGTFALDFKISTEEALSESNVVRVEAQRLLNLFDDYLFVPPKVETYQNGAVSESDFQNSTEKIKQRSFSIAGLGAIIPLLINEDVRTYLSSFVQGLLGLNSQESLNTLKTSLTGITAVLGGVFAYKVFKQVGDTLNAVKSLSRSTAILFGITESATESVLEKNDELEKEREKTKKENKEVSKSKEKISGVKKELKEEKQKLKDANIFKKASAFVTKIAPSVGKKLLGAIPLVGTAATIGFLIYEVADEAINFFSDEKTNESSPKQDNLVAKDNISEQSTPEVVQKSNLSEPPSRSENKGSMQQPSGAQLSAPSPAMSISPQTNNATESSPQIQLKGEVNNSTSSGVDSSKIIQQDKSKLEEIILSANGPVKESISLSQNINDSVTGSLSSVILPNEGEISPVSLSVVGDVLNKKSEEIMTMKKQLSKKSQTVVNIFDNSTYIGSQNQMAPTMDSLSYASTSVGD